MYFPLTNKSTSPTRLLVHGGFQNFSGMPGETSRRKPPEGTLLLISSSRSTSTQCATRQYAFVRATKRRNEVSVFPKRMQLYHARFLELKINRLMVADYCRN